MEATKVSFFSFIAPFSWYPSTGSLVYRQNMFSTSFWPQFRAALRLRKIFITSDFDSGARAAHGMQEIFLWRWDLGTWQTFSVHPHNTLGFTESVWHPWWSSSDDSSAPVLHLSLRHVSKSDYMTIKSIINLCIRVFLLPSTLPVFYLHTVLSSTVHDHRRSHKAPLGLRSGRPFFPISTLWVCPIFYKCAWSFPEEL